MEQLIKSSYDIKVVTLGYSPSQRKSTIKSRRCESLEISLGGIVGDIHEGEQRRACVRVKALHPRDTLIKNERQITMVSVEELRQIAQKLGVSEFDERWLGANLLIEGLPDLSHLPPGSRLQGPSGVTLVADLQNHPCSVVKRTINEAQSGAGEGFIEAAKGLRGITLFAERSGTLFVGDTLTLYLPTQRAWNG